MGFRRPGFGPRGPKIVSKVRRTQVQAYTVNWEAISAAVITRDGSRCRKCGCGRTPDNKLRAHHILPVSKGGQTVMWNLTTLCDRCHSKEPGHGHLAKQRRKKGLK